MVMSYEKYKYISAENMSKRDFAEKHKYIFKNFEF